MATKILKEKTVFSGVIFDVIERLYQSPEQGKFPRQIIHMHQDAVAVLIWDSETDRIYNSHEFRSGLNQEIDSITAGKIDDGETPMQAVLRELKEETGIIFTDIEPESEIHKIATINSSEGALDEQVHLFAIKAPFSKSQRTEKKFDADEFVTGQFVDRNDWANKILHTNGSGPAVAAALWLQNQK